MFDVENIMKCNVLVASPEETIRIVINRMGENRVSGLCVVDALGYIVGVITEYDLLRAFHESRMDDTVAHNMSPEVVTVPLQTTLEELMELFVEKRLRRVFVAEEGKLQGVVSRRDLLYAAQSRQQLAGFRQG